MLPFRALERRRLFLKLIRELPQLARPIFAVHTLGSPSQSGGAPPEFSCRVGLLFPRLLLRQRLISFVIENFTWVSRFGEMARDHGVCATGALIARYGTLVDAPDQRLTSIRAWHVKMTRYFRAMALTASTADLMMMSLRFAAHYEWLSKADVPGVNTERTARPEDAQT